MVLTRGTKRKAPAESEGEATGSPEEPASRIDGGSAPSPPDAPQPSTLLHNYSLPVAFLRLDLGVSLNKTAYQEAKSQPWLCNLQLKVSSASQQDLQSFPAKLPAADAYTLSPVLGARMKSWDRKASEDGVIQLDLQIGIPQQLLDTVVCAVYARKLTVFSTTIEGMLLLADYLQLDWLTKVLARYLQGIILPDHPGLVCQLNMSYPGLGLSKASAERILKQLQPKDMATLVKVDAQAWA